MLPCFSQPFQCHPFMFGCGLRLFASTPPRWLSTSPDQYFFLRMLSTCCSNVPGQHFLQHWGTKIQVAHRRAILLYASCVVSKFPPISHIFSAGFNLLRRAQGLLPLYFLLSDSNMSYCLRVTSTTWQKQKHATNTSPRHIHTMCSEHSAQLHRFRMKCGMAYLSPFRATVREVRALDRRIRMVFSCLCLWHFSCHFSCCPTSTV